MSYEHDASSKMGGAYKNGNTWHAVEKLRNKRYVGSSGYKAWRAVLYQMELEALPHPEPVAPESSINSHVRVQRLIRAGVSEEYILATITLLLETGK